MLFLTEKRENLESIPCIFMLWRSRVNPRISVLFSVCSRGIKETTLLYLQYATGTAMHGCIVVEF